MTVCHSKFISFNESYNLSIMLVGLLDDRIPKYHRTFDGLFPFVKTEFFFDGIRFVSLPNHSAIFSTWWQILRLSEFFLCKTAFITCFSSIPSSWNFFSRFLIFFKFCAKICTEFLQKGSELDHWLRFLWSLTQISGYKSKFRPQKIENQAELKKSGIS